MTSRTMNASPEVIWDVLANFGAISSWASNVDHSCLLTDGDVGIGTVRRIQSGPLTILETITEWEPGSLLTYTLEGFPAAIGFVSNSWSIQPDLDLVSGRTSTVVTLTTRVEAGPKPGQKLVAKVLTKKLESVAKQLLAGVDDATRSEQ